MTMRELYELPPAEDFRELYREDQHGHIGVGMILKSLCDEVYRLGTEISSMNAKAIEKKIDDRVKYTGATNPEELWPPGTPFAYTIRKKNDPGYVWATWSSRKNAEEMMHRTGLSTDEWEIYASEIRSLDENGNYIQPKESTRTVYVVYSDEAHVLQVFEMYVSAKLYAEKWNGKIKRVEL